MSSINRHFKRENWYMVAMFAVPAVLGLVAAIVLPDLLARTEAKRCNESGGSYNYKSGSCTPGVPAKK
jgi:hypothetical protein